MALSVNGKQKLLAGWMDPTHWKRGKQSGVGRLLSARNVWSYFLRLVNQHRVFVSDFAELAVLLNAITKKINPYKHCPAMWMHLCQLLQLQESCKKQLQLSSNFTRLLKSKDQKLFFLVNYNARQAETTYSANPQSKSSIPPNKIQSLQPKIRRIVFNVFS